LLLEGFFERGKFPNNSAANWRIKMDSMAFLWELENKNGFYGLLMGLGE
jgi:hypothetical protein